MADTARVSPASLLAEGDDPCCPQARRHSPGTFR